MENRELFMVFGKNKKESKSQNLCIFFGFIILYNNLHDSKLKVILKIKLAVRGMFVLIFRKKSY